jgi:hypothetical protein
MGAGVRGYPHWSPDGRSIVFHSAFEGQWDVYLIPSSGGKPRNLTSNPANDFLPSFSRDGKWVYFDSKPKWGVSGMEGTGIRWGACGGERRRRIRAPGIAGWGLPILRSNFRCAKCLVARAALWWRSQQMLEGVVLANFVVLKGGIYYIDRPSGQRDIHYFNLPSGTTRLQYFNFATRRSTTVVRNLGTVDIPLTATADGRTILFPRIDSSVDDLMLVENFR